MKIIQSTASHYPGLAEVINAIYPENKTSASDLAVNDQQRDPRFKFQRWVAIDQERVVGAGSYNQSIWFDHPQKFLVWVGVTPEYQGRGIGSSLYEAIVLGLTRFNPIALRSTTSDNQSQSIQFLEKRGFQEVIRDILSELDVQAFDLGRFSGLEDRLRDKGVTIKTLAELENDPERNQKLYDLDWELSLSVPGDLAAAMGRRGLDKYVEYAITGPDAIPGCYFIAQKGDEYIGLSHAVSIEKGVSLYQGLTGVKPAYKRMGIGLAMKVRCIAYAKSAGYSLIRAENDSKNKPMLAMNGKLGYVRKHDVITFEKQC